MLKRFKVRWSCWLALGFTPARLLHTCATSIRGYEHAPAENRDLAGATTDIATRCKTGVGEARHLSPRAVANRQTSLSSRI